MKKSIFKLMGFIFAIIGVVMALLAVFAPLMADNAEDLFVLELVFGLMGGIFLFIGLVFLCIEWAKTLRKNRLISEGYTVEAEIDSIDFQPNYMINGRHPYVINCRYTNKDTGEVYFYRSEHIWFNPAALIESRAIKLLRVYVERHNMKKYYVSLEPISENVNVY